MDFQSIVVEFIPPTQNNAIASVQPNTRPTNSNPIQSPLNPVATTQTSKINPEELGVVIDQERNLMWMKCSLGQKWNKANKSCDGDASGFTWKQARAQAKTSNHAGFNDWRVPTIDELESLVYCSTGKSKHKGRLQACPKGYNSPVVELKKFPNTPKTSFWTITSNHNYTNGAWYISFSNGYSDGYRRSGSNNLRLVRTNQ